MHALWTLEGLGAVDAALVREKLKDASPQVRAAAIRVSETLFKKGDDSLRARAVQAHDQRRRPDGRAAGADDRQAAEVARLAARRHAQS